MRALRESIAKRHRQRSGQPVDADQVVVLAGAQCALFSVAQCVLNPGDEVIVAEPMYVTYEAVFGACGAVVIPVPVRSGERLSGVARRRRRAHYPAHSRLGAQQPAQPVRRQPAAHHLAGAGRAVHRPRPVADFR